MLANLKTAQDGGLIKKQREVNMNVGAKVVHECKKRERAEEKERERSERITQFVRNVGLPTRASSLISKWRDKTAVVHYR